jgi:hypothetical protein
VAKSTRVFRRPFFLHIAEWLRIEPADLPKCFQKKIGDNIEPGEIIAQKKTGINVKDFVSPVSGIIEKILPTGTVIAREKPDFANKIYIVDVAKKMNIKPGDLDRNLVVKVGQEVERGQLIAGSLIKGSSRVSRSPIRGKIKKIDYDEGSVSVEPLLEETGLTAWLPGMVEDVNDRGCVISNRGTIIGCLWGQGNQVAGRLREDDGDEGDIVFRKSVEAVDLEQLRLKRIAGLICPGLHLQDIDNIEPPYAVVVTEGFGCQTMSDTVLKALEMHMGKIACLDPHTQLRAGVMRPRIVLPVESE